MRKRRSNYRWESGSAAASLLVVLLAICGSQNVFGQTHQDTLLPDLAPREVEILGDIEFGFPSLRRKPLTGFNPPPRIFEVPRGRMPFTGEYKQASANLPGTSLIQPATPPGAISVGQHPSRGELTLGIGRFLSREIHAIASTGIGENAKVYGDLLHDGYEQFKPFGDQPELEAPYQRYRGTGGVTYNLGASTIGAEIEGFSTKYDLYGLTPDDSTADRPDRDGQGFMIRGHYQGASEAAVPVRLRIGVGSNRYETRILTGEDQNSEARFELDADTRMKIAGRDVRLDASFGRSAIDDGATTDSNILAYEVGGDVYFDFGEMGTVWLGAQIHGFSASDNHFVTGTSSSKLYIAPRVEYRNTVGKGIEFFVQNIPIVNNGGQETILEMNPFVADGPLVMPELAAINLETGLVYYAGPVRVSVRGGVSMYENYRFFEAADAVPAGYSGNVFDTGYGEVDTYFFGGDVAVAFPGRFSASMHSRWQNATLEADQTVPYFAGFVSGLRGSYTFPGDRAMVQLDGQYIGSRPVDRAGNDEISGSLDLSALASYYVNSGVGVYARVKTIAGDGYQRWEGYPVANWIVLGGVRLRW